MDNKKGGYIIVVLPQIEYILREEDEGYETKPFDYEKAMSIYNSKVMAYVKDDNGNTLGMSGVVRHASGRYKYTQIHTTWEMPIEYGFRYAAYELSIDTQTKTATVTKIDIP